MLSVKALTIGLVMGLIIGLAIGYVILPKDVDTTALEQQVTQLKTTISNLELQISGFHAELQTKIDQLDELEAKLSDLTNLETQISALKEEIEELKKLIPP